MSEAPRDAAPDAASAIPRDMAGSAAEAARLLRLMGHDGRLMVLCHLAAGDRTVSDLVGQLGLSQSALSQHLARLRAEGLVRARREGVRVTYSLTSDQARRLVEVVHGLYCRA